MSTQTKAVITSELAELKNFIDGEFLVSSEAKIFETCDPTVGRPFALVHEASADAVDQAVQAARRALDGDWGRMSNAERSEHLF